MDYIDIKGYKSIRDQRIELKPINILIGANGSGKSNFISFFEFLNALYNKGLNNYIALRNRDRILFEGKKITKEIQLKFEFGNGLNGYSATIKSGDEDFIFMSEKLLFEGNSWEIASSQKEACVRDDPKYRTKYIRAFWGGLKIYHFHDVGSDSPFAKPSNIKDNIYYLEREGGNIASFLYNIRETDTITYNWIVRITQSVAPYFYDFLLEPNESDLVELKWRDKFSDTVYGVPNLSDGTMRFIALVVLFMQPKLPQTIIIDEPELGLHPTALAKLSGLIKSAAAKGCQIIVATQSSDLISYFEPEDIITVDQVNGESKFKRLNTEELANWLEDYTIDDLWKRSIIDSGQVNY